MVVREPVRLPEGLAVVGLADLEPGRSTSLLMAVASPEVVTCMSAVSSDAGTGQQTLDTGRIEPGYRLDV